MYVTVDIQIVKPDIITADEVVEIVMVLLEEEELDVNTQYN